ncbi:hypothetical protein FRC17_001142 [Serendipita sp. 399]|nr:hypothetical protein FRC17_001142 [Serendipita sp. 399]
MLPTSISSGEDDSSVSSRSDVHEAAPATTRMRTWSTTGSTQDKGRTLYFTVARIDQAPLGYDDADYAELRSIACSSESDLSEYFSDYLNDAPAIQGSQQAFSSTTSTYMLPIGCGSGQWALEFATECSKVKVMAVDETPQMPDELPANLKFQRHDANEGLMLYYDSYDVVHVRCIGAGITSYRQLLVEVFHCLRPGGVAMFIEGDFDLLAENQMTIIEPASDSNPNGSWLQRWVQTVRKGQVRRCQPTDPSDSPEILDKGLWQVELYESSTCGTGSIFTPISPWPESDLAEESLHYKVVGVLMRQNLKLFLHSTQPLLIDEGISEEDTAAWMARALAELDGPVKAWFRWRVAWGRRAPDSTVSTVKATPVASSAPFKAHMFPSPRNIEARKNLLEKVKYFTIPQCHIRNEQQSLDYIKQREATPFSTRGIFD